MITLPVFTVDFLLKTGRRLVHLGRALKLEYNCIYVVRNKGIEFALHNAQVLKCLDGSWDERRKLEIFAHPRIEAYNVQILIVLRSLSLCNVDALSRCVRRTGASSSEGPALLYLQIVS